MQIRRNWILLGALATTGAMTSQGVGAAQNCAGLARPGYSPIPLFKPQVVAADAKTGCRPIAR